MEDRNRLQGLIKKSSSHMGLFLIIVSPINIAFPHREFGLKQDPNVRPI